VAVRIEADGFRAVAFKTAGRVHLTVAQSQGLQRAVSGHRSGAGGDAE